MPSQQGVTEVINRLARGQPTMECRESDLLLRVSPFVSAMLRQSPLDSLRSDRISWVGHHVKEVLIRASKSCKVESISSKLAGSARYISCIAW